MSHIEPPKIARFGVFRQARYFVRHEATKDDEGRPLGAGLQEQASNHLKLHRSRAVAVFLSPSAWEKIL